MKEYIVSLHNREDLDNFYNDMETEGGDLYIPNRAVDVTNRRTISRNTHYMLTDEEAQTVKQDPRVFAVELKELLELSIRPAYKIDNGNFDKTSSNDASDVNWGLLRHSEITNRNNWGVDITSNVIDNLTVTASGKNIDVIIVDGHIDPNHPEFAVNSDGTGGSRVQQFNWFQNDIGSGTGTYVYAPYIDSSDTERTSDNNHGAHCGGTVAGNTQGWARDANIYNISPYITNPNYNVNGFGGTTMWDYIRQWHNNKPINTDTGRRNPTITNNSYGSSIRFNQGDLGPITSVTYRGVTTADNAGLNIATMQANGIYTFDTTPTVPYYSTSVHTDLQDAIDDGIIIVFAAGNDYWKIDVDGGQDWDNQFIATFSGTTYLWDLHKGSGSAAYPQSIVVGALSNNDSEDKAVFSNCGPRVDIYAAGQGIQSSVHNGGVTDPRNSSYDLEKLNGTSMASPQVAGVLAILAESWPSMTQQEAKDWLINNSRTNLMYDTGADNAVDTNSLQGSPNRILYWQNKRAAEGFTFPSINVAARPTSGNVYPRTKVRRKG